MPRIITHCIWNQGYIKRTWGLSTISRQIAVVQLTLGIVMIIFSYIYNR